jgi:GT2 family glycosyltransferase
MANVGVAVIIVNWNTRELLESCLRSVAESFQGVAHAVCVVDNGSTDGSAAMVRQKFPAARVVENAGNAGFARACNQGVAAIPESDYVLFLNPDTRISSGAVTELLGALDRHPDMGAATCALVDPAGRFQKAQGHRLPTVLTAFHQYLFLNRLLSDRIFPGVYWARRPNRPQTVQWISGALFLVRRKAMGKGPFFDESYFLYGEDLEASLVLRRAGWALLFVPNVEAVHHLKGGVRKSPPSVFQSQVQGPLIFLRRHTSPGVFQAVRALMALGFILRGLASGAGHALGPRDRSPGSWTYPWRHLADLWRGQGKPAGVPMGRPAADIP